MKALQKYMLAQTFVLLICQIATSQICKCLINMVDGFHTLFIFIHMVVVHSQKTGISMIAACAKSPSSHSPVQTTSSRPSLQPPTPETDVFTITSVANSNDHNSFISTNLTRAASSSATFQCGLSYSKMRIHSVEMFTSALLLVTLCASFCLESAPHILEPQSKQLPFVAILAGAFSVLHNTLVLGLNWQQLQGNRTGAPPRPHLEVISNVMKERNTGVPRVRGCVVDASRATAAAKGSFAGEPLLLCNPGTSSELDPEPGSNWQAKNEGPSAVGVHLHAATAQGVPPEHYKEPPSYTDPGRLISCRKDGEVPNSITDTETFYVGHISSNTSDQDIDNLKSSPQWPDCLPRLTATIQALLSPILALTNGLVLFLVVQDCLPRSWPCSTLDHLDGGFSLVAAVVLLAKALPQVYLYGLLLLQAAPSHVCVPEIKLRISSVPGVQSVHDFHIWQLTDTCTVASVHVHCQDGFQIHRCGDLINGVTKVLHSVGVCCCTIQPEFAPPSEAINSHPNQEISSSATSDRKGALACSLACGKDCAEKMCCSPPLEKPSMAPSSGEIENDAHMFVIENPSLKI